MGPAIFRYALFGATEPADSAVATAPSSVIWTDFGGTADGTDVSLEVDLTYTDLMVDQLIDAVGARLTKRLMQVSATLEEATLQNMLAAQNQLGTIGSGAGYATYDPATASSATQPTYTALMIDGWAPTLNTGAAARRRIIIRKCLSATKLAMSFEKAKPSLFTTLWTGYYVSDSITPYHVADQTS
jgi:hypothetical protein